MPVWMPGWDRAAFTKQALDAQIDKIMAANQPATPADQTIYSAAPAPDGSGIQLTVKPSTLTRVRAAPPAAGGIPISVTAGAPLTFTTWRWNDTYPLIGGDVLVGPVRGGGPKTVCTAGLAVENSSGRDFLLTADHCFPQGSKIYGDGNTVGYFPSNPFFTSNGNYAGTVLGTNSDHWDTEVIDTGRYNGAGTNADAATVNGSWDRINTDNYSYNGDSVCEDGAVAYYTHNQAFPCGIVVINQDTTFTGFWDDGTQHTARGVIGQGPANTVVGGDSGALVFTGEPVGSLEDARGDISGVAVEGSNYQNIFWVEIPDILSYFHYNLNPHN
jgi:hypothetical protein